MVIRELLEMGRLALDGLEYVDPIKEVSYLLSKILEVDRSFLYTNLDQPISKKVQEKFLDLLKRRASGEPLSYIFKLREFMGIDFFVEKGVLIPRPETEMIVEYIIDYVEKNFKEKTVKILDIGIGTGAISLSLAKNLENSRVLGVDIEDIPLEVAQRNKENLKLENVTFIKSDLFENIKEDEKFSLIVSNPPYIRTSLLDELQDDVKNFEPKAALDGGDDGLLFYRRITSQASDYLLQDGMLIYEIGFDQGESVKKILEDEGFRDIVLVEDFQGLDRMVLGFKK